MISAKIELSNIEEVKTFVAITNQYSFKINLLTDRYKIDAKSIMGVFSLDLSQPITLEMNTDDADDFLEKIQSFIIQ